MRILHIWAAKFLLLLGAWAASNSMAVADDYKGNFMVRTSTSIFNPDSGAKVYSNGTLQAGAGARVSSEIIPSATLTYFFDKNYAIELFCCAAKIDIDGRGTLAGTHLGDTWIFPPAVTLQYHFKPSGGIKPYIGAGVHYIAFFDEGLSELTGNPRLNVDDAWGFTAQIGVDVELGKNWYLNLDVKKTWVEADALWEGSSFTADVQIDPIIVSFGAGYRFDLFNRKHKSYK